MHISSLLLLRIVTAETYKYSTTNVTTTPQLKPFLVYTNIDVKLYIYIVIYVKI